MPSSEASAIALANFARIEADLERRLADCQGLPGASEASAGYASDIDICHIQRTRFLRLESGQGDVPWKARHGLASPSDYLSDQIRLLDMLVPR